MGDKDKKPAKWLKAEPSARLSIDSPMVVVHTDLATALGEGDSTVPDSPTNGGGEEPAPPKQPAPPDPAAPPNGHYVAVCEEGHQWMGSFHEEWADAAAEASAHEHGGAIVMLYLNGSMVGAVVEG